MMTDCIPKIPICYNTLPSMLRKYDRYARKDYFSGKSREEFEAWRTGTRALLKRLLGLEKMESCPLSPVVESAVDLPGGIRREHVRIQVEPDVWMPMYLLIPPDAGTGSRIYLCPPGHNGAGKYTVAGLREYSGVEEKIRHYQYDYGYQLAQLGYVAVCPDCRGFGERREDLQDANNPETAMGGDCYRLAHMGEPLGIPVAGMLTWDLMRAVDYLVERGMWNRESIGCVGFSGGGMQTLWLSALDERICMAVISGYLYGYRDALLSLNRNCSCNYVPHLWEHLDMGDIASLIVPRPLLVQSCRDDRLNGPRGIVNAEEQVEIIRHAYQLFDASGLMIHEICEGGHQWHGGKMKEHLEVLTHNYEQYTTDQEIFHG